MKKWIILGMMVVSSSVFSADGIVLSYSIQSICELTDVLRIDQITSEELCEVMEGQRPETAIEFPKSFKAPLKMFVTSEYLSLLGEGESERFMIVDQTFYLRNVSGEILFSNDLQQWKPVMDFFTGQISVALSVEEQSPRLTISAEVHER